MSQGHRHDRITPSSDPCRLAKDWGVDEAVMTRVVAAAQMYSSEHRGLPVDIISGARTRAEQLKLKRGGRQVADPEKSTHLSCPATGVDISLGLAPTREQISAWGTVAQIHGLRWGGGSPLEIDRIPSDWQHVDVGPRIT